MSPIIYCVGKDGFSLEFSFRIIREVYEEQHERERRMSEMKKAEGGKMNLKILCGVACRSQSECEKLKIGKICTNSNQPCSTIQINVAL